MIDGAGPAPRLVLALIKRFPDDSMTAASAAGGIEHFGWGTGRYLLADIFDAIQANTRACGNWRGRPPKLPHWPRPKRRKASRRPTSVADLHRRLGG